MCWKTKAKGTFATIAAAAVIGSAGCALQVASAAARTVLEHDKAFVLVLERLEVLDAKLMDHTRWDAEETAKLRKDVAATREGVARIEGRLSR